MDVDSSIIMVNKEGGLVDQIWFKQMKSNDRSIIHSGDNRTGEGSGDIETITIKLSQVSSDVHSIWPVVNVYNDGKSYTDVQGTYCRLFNPENDKEFCRFTLSSCLDKMSNGNIVASIQRDGSKWTMKGMGYYTKDTRKSTPMIPIIKELVQDIKTNVKILHEGENCTEHGWIGSGVTRSECT